MIWHSLERYRDLGLLIARVGFGLGFIFFHGWDKLTGGPERWAQVGSAMQNLGIRFAPTFFGFMASFSESVGGVLIALGLFFRPAAALLCFTMFVATVFHLASGQGTPAHAFKNAAVLLGFIFIGPGKYSLDEMLRRKLRSDVPEGGVA
jgi:putative oxidoreductase